MHFEWKEHRGANVHLWFSLETCGKKFISEALHDGWWKVDCLQWRYGQTITGVHDESPQNIFQSELYPRMVIASIWSDWKGVMFFKLLLANTAINFYVYYNQFYSLCIERQEKRLELINRNWVVFQLNNAASYKSLQTRKRLQ